MIKTIHLFGKTIDVEVDNNDGDDYAAVASGGGPELLFKKKLEESDVSPGQSRLLIPYGECPKILKFLTEEEMRLKNEKKKGVEVEVKDNRGRRFWLNLVYWESVKKFALNKGWNALVETNQLQRGDVIQLGCNGRIHDNEPLCFHLDICERRTLQLI